MAHMTHALKGNSRAAANHQEHCRHEKKVRVFANPLRCAKNNETYRDRNLDLEWRFEKGREDEEVRPR